MSQLHIDPQKSPNLKFRIDTFTIPTAVRGEFEAAMQRNSAFLKTLPGYLGHVVFEKASGASSHDVVTIATWESDQAIANAREQVQAYYQRIGFDVQDMLAKWGVKADLGYFVARAD
jgi:hypothetical protein